MREGEIMNLKYTNRKGFTLIELLIVIAIIGILAGIVIAVINPSLQRAKATQTIVRSNVSKACLALLACNASSSSGGCNCVQNDWACLGVNNASFTTGTYTYAGGTGSIVGTTPNNSSGTCTITCNGATGTITLATCDLQ